MQPTVDYSSIAKAIIDQLGSQVGLATTLATAISGGLIALVIQIAMHNGSNGASQLKLSYTWLIVCSLVSEGISLLFGYLARGTITDIAPIIMQLPAAKWQNIVGTNSEPLTFGAVQFAGSSTLACFVRAQFILMIVGLIFTSVFAYCNLGVLLEQRKKDGGING